MKQSIPAPVVVGAIIVVLGVAIFFIWNSMQPIKSEANLPDAPTMTDARIAEIKNMEHGMDEARGRK